MLSPTLRAGRRDGSVEVQSGMPSQVLALTDDMPDQQLAPGEVLYGQGDGGSHSVAVLVHGTSAWSSMT